MITDLHIENVAVIEKADISFNKGLNVLTGETGAGKSIVIDSLNAVLGNRTSKDLVRTGNDYAVVSAVFTVPDKLDWFVQNDIEQPSEIIIQRKISADGKSSCRICGYPVTASQLKELSVQLLDIHGQNDGQRLLDEKSHLGFLDSYGNHAELLDNYLIHYNSLVSLFKQIKALTTDDDEKQFLSQNLSAKITELTNANLKDGEYEQILAKLDLLRNSEKLKDSLDDSAFLLNDSDNSVLSMLAQVESDLDKSSSVYPELNSILSTVKDSIISIKDVYDTVNNRRSALDFSEDEYNNLESRKQTLDRLMRKYSCDEKGLIDLIVESQKKLDELQYSDLKIEKLKKEYALEKESCYQLAKRLTDKRKETAALLEKQITKELSDLNMPSVKFKVSFDSEPKLTRHGMDDVKFLMSANAGEEVGRISKIASGGELSRIMLALKNVFSKNDSVETMIFDEIDTGVSGISAQRVAEKLYQVSKDKQVMCVTHLPQIASFADSHYVVKKEELNNRTYTDVHQLSFDERVREIARLYGGDNITAITLAAAEEQLNKSKDFKRSYEL